MFQLAFPSVEPSGPTTNPMPCLDEAVVRRLSQCGATGEDCISALRSLNLDDDFWMYDFKVVPCAKTYSHKWTLCPCAHAGETARRRDPRTVSYKAVLCPLVKAKKTCPLGDACSYAHNVFEHWLHPSRYKTRLCSFGRNCNRPICFFAHSADELRCVQNLDDGKELDEREYLLQLMMAQDTGLLQTTHLHQMPSPVQALADIVNPASGSNLQPASSLQLPLQGMQMLPGPNRPRQPARAVSMNGAPTMASQNATAEAMLVNLQEALAGVTLGVDGLSAVSGAPHQGRISDPGTGCFPASTMLGAVNPIPAMNRISDSGQAMGVVSSKGLAAGLESFQSLLGQLSVPKPGVGSPPMSRSPPPTSLSTSPASESPMQQAATPRASTPPSQQQALKALLNALPAGAVSNGSAPSTPSGTPTASNASLNQVINQLQEQGMSAGTKEQLVAQLSQLLAQLLSVN